MISNPVWVVSKDSPLIFVCLQEQGEETRKLTEYEIFQSLQLQVHIQDLIDLESNPYVNKKNKKRTTIG